MALFSDRTWDDWVSSYAQSHEHRANQRCHFVGIPMIMLSLALGGASIAYRPLLLAAAVLFGAGWALQFIGHAIERKPPEFLKDWRFLFVGLRWWLWKVTGATKRPPPTPATLP